MADEGDFVFTINKSMLFGAGRARNRGLHFAGSRLPLNSQHMQCECSIDQPMAVNVTPLPIGQIQFGAQRSFRHVDTWLRTGIQRMPSLDWAEQGPLLPIRQNRPHQAQRTRVVETQRASTPLIVDLQYVIRPMSGDLL
ncbi:hypothetical protein WK17_25700 [Burkholderia multivorans]|nr:hypothetical protein WK17_25700 [Burkholderia multivorans]